MVSMSNSNVVSKKEKHYFGTMKNALESEFHTSSSDNKNFQNGNVCIGCHSHKKNKAKLNVCSTNISNEMDRANCVSCHMPKVDGSVSNVRETKKAQLPRFSRYSYTPRHAIKIYRIRILEKYR